MIHHVGSILLRSNKPLLTSIFTAQLLTNAFVVLTLFTHVPVFSAEQDKSRQDRVIAQLNTEREDQLTKFGSSIKFVESLNMSVSEI